MATLKTGWMQKLVNNVVTKVFAISHVKSTYYNYTEGTMLDEVLIETEDFDQTAVTEPEISPAILTLIKGVETEQANNYTLLNNNKADSTAVYTKEEVDNLVASSGGGEGYVSGNTPPEDTTQLWLDTSAGGILKYYDATSSSWEPTKSTWG